MKNSVCLLGLLFLFSCKEQEARRPIQASTSVTIYNAKAKESAAEKELASAQIAIYLAQDTTTTYLTSLKGFWYAYSNQVMEERATPKNGDQIEITFTIKDLNHQILYSNESVGTNIFTVGTASFIPAIEDEIKLMKIGETCTFVLPSSILLSTFTNQYNIISQKSIIITITLNNIK